jgi:hypothetical protein
MYGISCSLLNAVRHMLCKFCGWLTSNSIGCSDDVQFHWSKDGCNFLSTIDPKDLPYKLIKFLNFTFLTRRFIFGNNLDVQRALLF